MGSKRKQGFGFVEVLVGIAVFAIIAVSIYETYKGTLRIIRVSRLKITATALANEQMEIIRNLPYADVGILNGLPAGKIPHSQITQRDGVNFTVVTTIRNIDDPFDGIIGGVPNDLSPADYKLAEIDITCPGYNDFQPLKISTRVAPKNLEMASTNGALFLRVFDANGIPIQGVNIHIENNMVAPSLVIDDETNNSGLLQLVDVPPGAEAYEITVSKPGYSTEKTYPTGALGNPNPTRPHSTVVLQQVTQTSFSIDKISAVNISTMTENCSPVGNIDFSIQGSKLIGTNPDVYKYDKSTTTGSGGTKTISGLEWDTYGLSLTDEFYYLAGANPLLPLNLPPNANQNLQLIVAPKEPNALLATVRDAGTSLPLSGASTTLQKVGYEKTLITGRGFFNQTDWSGGDGQADFIDKTGYFSGSDIDTASPVGEARLRNVFGEYMPSGELVSSTFDTGSASNFYQINWQPQDQPPQTGADSVRFQIAANNDKAIWNFFGPDGTVSTFYTLSNTNINSVHNGQRYLRYKLYLQTASTTFTPNISDVSFAFTSACVPSGQVLFSGLAADTYTLTVSRDGYQTYIGDVNISSGWQEQQVLLSP